VCVLSPPGTNLSASYFSFHPRWKSPLPEPVLALQVSIYFRFRCPFFPKSFLPRRPECWYSFPLFLELSPFFFPPPFLYECARYNPPPFFFLVFSLALFEDNRRIPFSVTPPKPFHGALDRRMLHVGRLGVPLFCHPSDFSGKSLFFPTSRFSSDPPHCIT